MGAKGDIIDELWGDGSDDAFIAVVVFALGVGAFLHWLLA